MNPLRGSLWPQLTMDFSFLYAATLLSKHSVGAEGVQQGGRLLAHKHALASTARQSPQLLLHREPYQKLLRHSGHNGEFTAERKATSYLGYRAFATI